MVDESDDLYHVVEHDDNVREDNSVVAAREFDSMIVCAKGVTDDDL